MLSDSCIRTAVASSESVSHLSGTVIGLDRLVRSHGWPRLMVLLARSSTACFKLEQQRVLVEDNLMAENTVASNTIFYTPSRYSKHEAN